jgi:PadR family transcriptional regulator PadR
MAEIREATYFVLAALIDGPLHGYAIVQSVVDLSDGSVRLSAGTLYGALTRLAVDGLVEDDGEEVVSGRRRRRHRLTDDGRAKLLAEARRLRASAAVVESRLGATAPAVSS